ncbi:MAG: hypothetical protein Q8S55_07020, partial [Methylococcaceae bacterium]|nr:hypothetical protein [Methylococcaceae bacterium]
LSRSLFLKPVFAPAGELLSFAASATAPALLYLLHPCSRKESNQRKGDPDAAYFLRSSLSTGVARRAFPGPLPTRRIHAATLAGCSYRKLRCSARHTGDPLIIEQHYFYE